MKSKISMIFNQAVQQQTDSKIMQSLMKVDVSSKDNRKKKELSIEKAKPIGGKKKVETGFTPVDETRVFVMN